MGVEKSEIVCVKRQGCQYLLQVVGVSLEMAGKVGCGTASQANLKYSVPDVSRGSSIVAMAQSEA